MPPSRSLRGLRACAYDMPPGAPASHGMIVLERDDRFGEYALLELRRNSPKYQHKFAQSLARFLKHVWNIMHSVAG